MQLINQPERPPIRIHLLDGTHVDTSEYSLADAEATRADGADIEITDPGAPLGTRLIGHTDVANIEEVTV